MKRCDHTHWLSLCRQSGRSTFLQSDRLDMLINELPHPYIQQPSLFVLIGSADKSVAARALFGLKKNRRSLIRPRSGEVHLHIDPSTSFADRPILLADCDARQRVRKWDNSKSDKCHETARYLLRRPLAAGESAADVYMNLLSPFADVFCFFSDDLGGFRQIAQRLALWLEKGPMPTLPKTALPSIVIVTSKFVPGVEAEDEAKRAFLWMLREETTKDPDQYISAIDVVALFPNGAVSAEARYRRVKERLMERSDQVRKQREDSRLLFSATHFSAFLKSASAHFADSPITPFDLIKASRVDNPVAPDMVEHFSNFWKHITSSNQLMEFAAPMLASSLLLDSYPPDAHSTQHPLLATQAC
jgi:hypothetical protein